MPERNSVRCDQCGQVDDHPKAHVYDGTAARTYHHDCLPYALRAQVVEHDVARRIVEAAESGVHGDKLRARIEQLHKEE